MQNVIIPVDGSDASSRALETAIRLTQNTEGAKLHVLNIQSPIVSQNVTRFFSTEMLQDYYEDEGKKALVPALTILEKTERNHTSKVLVGALTEVLKNYIAEHNCDHIVMGTRGLGAMPGLILGSVTTKVLNTVDVPVTLVK